MKVHAKDGTLVRKVAGFYEKGGQFLREDKHQNHIHTILHVKAKVKIWWFYGSRMVVLCRFYVSTKIVN